MSTLEPHSQLSDHLFVVTHNGEFLNTDFDAQQLGAVSVPKMYAHLANIQDLYIEEYEFNQKAKANPLPKNAGTDYVPTRAQSIALNAGIAAERLRQQARGEFYEAIGVSAMLATGLYSDEFVMSNAAKSYNLFTRMYKGRHRVGELAAATDKWRSNLDFFTGRVESVAEQPSDTPTSTLEGEAHEAGLSTREKLLILAEAEHAGFLPTTNEEKNMVLTYLDYIKNEAFNLGAQSQLLEVGNFHGKHHSYATAKDFALQAGRSIANEFGDWFVQSEQQLADLFVVKELLQATDNPDLSLAVALHADMLKAIPLLRFIDLTMLRDKGEIAYKFQDMAYKPKFDVLRTRRNESKELLQEGKNKVLEDPYTGTRSKAATNWLKLRMMQVKVGDVRKIIEAAILDQTNRMQFHKLVLEDLAQEKTDSILLKEASKTARGILQSTTV